MIAKNRGLDAMVSNILKHLESFPYTERESKGAEDRDSGGDSDGDVDMDDSVGGGEEDDDDDDGDEDEDDEVEEMMKHNPNRRTRTVSADRYSEWSVFMKIFQTIILTRKVLRFLIDRLGLLHTQIGKRNPSCLIQIFETAPSH